MALPAPLQALFDRLQTYNSDAYNSSSNPGGFARGGNQKPVDNFIKSIRDFTAFGRGISDNVDGSVDAAAGSAGLAKQEAEIATAERQAAQNAATNSYDQAQLSAASAVESANQAQKLVGTSATAVTTGTGSKTFATQPNKHFGVGQFLTIVSTAVVTRWMHGQVTAYKAATGALTVNVGAIGPTTGTVSSWNIYTASPAGPQGIQGIPGIATMPYLARSANTQLVAGDSASLIDATGTFTQTFATPATLGANWYCLYKNAGTGNITIPASDGRTNWIMYPGEMRLFQCDGTTLRSEVLNPFYFTAVSGGTFVPPPGYTFFEGFLWAGGGGTATGGGGAGGGACTPIRVLASALSNSVSFTIGAGGAAGSSSVQPSPGGNSTFGPFSAFGGGVPSGNEGGGGGGSLGAPTILFASPAGGAPGGGLMSAGAGGAYVYPSAAGGGGGGRNTTTGDSNTPYRKGQNTDFGGAGGGGIQGAGGDSLHGGAGGAGSSGGANSGGQSLYGGNGGGPGQPGQIPGGGAGASSGVGSAGGRGELILWGVV